MSNDSKSEFDKLVVDNPIDDKGDDKLGRSEAAIDFARNVLRLDYSRGAVVGVFGPWGSGKTSFVNLAKKELESRHASVVEFNPWMFSNSQQLVERFFTEIASQLKIPEHKDLGIDIVKELKLLGGDFTIAGIGRITRYLDSFFKVIIGDIITDATGPNGPMSDKDSKILKEKWDKYKEYIEAKYQNEGWGIINRRNNIEEKLRSLDEKGRKELGLPIIVIVDDVDRLSNKEIGDVFRLIRLTANFPNIIYIVPCDRRRIEEALNDAHGIGRNFIEKIIQFGYDLPETNQSLLIDEIDNCIASVQPGVKDQDTLGKERMICDHIVYPLMRNMRDVRRYGSAIHSTLSNLEGKVVQADVLALETIRLFIPDAFKLLPSVIDILTTTSHLSARTRYSESSENSYFNNKLYYGIRLAELFVPAQEHAWTIYSMIEIIFPHAKKYLPQLEHNETSAVPNVIPKMPNDLASILDNDQDTTVVAPRCVANMDIFQIYLDRIPNQGVGTLENLEKLLDCMPNVGRLNKYLHGLNRKEFYDVIVYLDHYESKIHPDYVPTGIVELSNCMMRVHNIYDISLASKIIGPDPALSLQGVVVKLLGSLPYVDKEPFFRIFNAIKSLSVKYGLVKELEAPDSQISDIKLLVPLDDVQQALCRSIKNAAIDDLAAEWYLPEILLWSKSNCPEVNLSRDYDPKYTFLVVWAFRTEPFNDVRRLEVLQPTDHNFDINWNGLTECYDMSTLKHMVETMCENFDQVLTWSENKGLSKEPIELIRSKAKEWLQ